MQANFSSSEVYLSWLEHHPDDNFITKQLLVYHFLPYAMFGLFKLSDTTAFSLSRMLDLRLFVVALLFFPICYLYALRYRTREVSYAAIAQFYYIMIFLFYLHWIFLALWILNTLGCVFEKKSRTLSGRLERLI